MSQIILEATITAVTLKTVVETLKEFLSNANLVFTKDAMMLNSIDMMHTCLVELVVYEGAFESYKCFEDSIIGVNFKRYYSD